MCSGFHRATPLRAPIRSPISPESLPLQLDSNLRPTDRESRRATGGIPRPTKNWYPNSTRDPDSTRAPGAASLRAVDPGVDPNANFNDLKAGRDHGKTRRFPRVSVRAADGIRTHDLLHGKQVPGARVVLRSAAKPASLGRSRPSGRNAAERQSRCPCTSDVPSAGPSDFGSAGHSASDRRAPVWASCAASPSPLGWRQAKRSVFRCLKRQAATSTADPLFRAGSWRGL
jgi:hypothetical protein